MLVADCARQPAGATDGLQPRPLVAVSVDEEGYYSWPQAAPLSQRRVLERRIKATAPPEDTQIGPRQFHTFAEFRDHLVETVERMNAGLDDPEATLPGVLFVEVPRRGLVVAEMRSLEGLSDFRKRDLAARVLPSRIRATNADRFA